MGQLITLSINANKLDQSRYVTDKNGNQWINISGFLNDEMDQYGNYGFVTQSPTKEERDAKVKMTILGNFRLPTKNQPAGPSIVSQMPIKPQASLPVSDDLPF
jgi:hypothetical protein